MNENNNINNYSENTPDPKAELKRRKKKMRGILGWFSLFFILILGIFTPTMIDSENTPDPKAELKRRKKKMRSILSWFSIFFILGICTTTMIDISQKWGCTEPVSAVVIEVVHRHSDIVYDSRDGDFHTISAGFAPVFKYTYNGVEYIHYTDNYYPKPSFKEGQETELLIDPNNLGSVYAPEEDYIRMLRLKILVGWIAYIVVVIIIMPEIKYRMKKL